MRTMFVPAMTIALLAGIACAQEKSQEVKESTPAAEKQDPKVIVEQSSYAIGLNFGRNLKREGVELNVELFVEGMKTAMSDAKPKWTNEELSAAMKSFEQILATQAAEKKASAGAKNLKEGKEFLETNSKKEGVKTLPSGLQYEVVEAGKGESPKSTDEVRTHYRGKLINGTEFDSSYERNEPAVFPVDKVIKGWTEALQLMKVGDKWKLYIPSDLAYGENGSPPVIGPNSVLVFDIELLGIEGTEPKETTDPGSK